MRDKKEDGSGLEFSGSVKIGDLVAYQEGSVVSRTIIDKKSGIVTLFAFDKGEGLSEHTSPYKALIYLIDGEAEATVAGQPNVLRKGDAILLPARKPHALKAKENFKMLLVMIR